MPAAKRVRPRRKRAKRPRPARPPAESTLRPAGTKVAEPPDNLRARAEWFKRRSGLG